MRVFLAGLLAAVVAAMILQLTQASRSHEVVISCGAAGLEFELCRTGALAWQNKTGHQVRVVSAPTSSTERLGLFTQLLASKSPDVDVFTVDTTWAGIIGDFFVDLRHKATDIDDDFPSFVENNTLNGHLVALPWYIDAGLLYYRSDLLAKYGQKVPETWEDLTEVAKLIQSRERAAGNTDLWGFVFEGRAYEGLTCNALEWLQSEGGGTIVDQDGHITINNPNAVKAIDLARSWIGTISPPGVLNYTEEEARGIFQSGRAIFLRSWPYVLKLASSPDSEIRGKFAAGPLPGHAAILGGWSLAVSKYSRHADEAIDLVLYLASAAEQKRRALTGGFYPTRRSLYHDEELRHELPMTETLYGIFEHALPRPARVVGAQYNRLSAEFWEAVHNTLAGNQPAEASLAELEPRLERLSNKGSWR